MAAEFAITVAVLVVAITGAFTNFGRDFCSCPTDFRSACFAFVGTVLGWWGGAGKAYVTRNKSNS